MEGKARKLEKKKIRLQIVHLQETNCVGCNLPPAGSAAKKQKYCWTNCVHGIAMRKLADQLLTDPSEMGFQVEIPEAMKPTKENYLYLKSKDIPDKRAAEILGIKFRALPHQKNAWGLPKIHDKETKQKDVPAPGVKTITMDEYESLIKDREKALKELAQKKQQWTTTFQSLKDRETVALKKLLQSQQKYGALFRQMQQQDVALESVTKRYTKLVEKYVGAVDVSIQ
jgi:hypothetical protein